MTNPITKIVNATTGEQVEREMNAKELAQWESDRVASQTAQAEQAAKDSSRQSALDKLAALGLTPEEISAITGS